MPLDLMTKVSESMIKRCYMWSICVTELEKASLPLVYFITQTAKTHGTLDSDN